MYSRKEIVSLGIATGFCLAWVLVLFGGLVATGDLSPHGLVAEFGQGPVLGACISVVIMLAGLLVVYLHALVHAQFRARKATDTVARVIARPWTARRRHAWASAHAVYHRVQAAVLQRRLDRLARLTAADPPMPLIPLLTPQAAAIPTDQSALE